MPTKQEIVNSIYKDVVAGHNILVHTEEPSKLMADNYRMVKCVMIGDIIETIIDKVGTLDEWHSDIAGHNHPCIKLLRLWNYGTKPLEQQENIVIYWLWDLFQELGLTSLPPT